MDEIEVPPYFLCPISLEMMRDPVAVSTGITYDRESIEKWVFSGKNDMCPVTKQVLSDSDLTPNHTLRRLIQSWCTLNASHGVERIPTPKPPVSRAQIAKLLHDARSPQLQIKCLRQLRSIASENETNRRCIEAAGAADFLASIVKKTNSWWPGQDGLDSELQTAAHEALTTLHHLRLSDASLRTLIGENGEFLAALTSVMEQGSYESRAYAVSLLKSAVLVAEPIQLMTLNPQILAELVRILHDQVSSKATKAALQLLYHLCPWGRNRVKAVEAGAVAELVDVLLESPEKRATELALTVLERLCQCAEGRAALLKHGAGLAAVSKKILRVSNASTEKAVKIILSIAKFTANRGVLQEMLQLGVVAKLCLVLQVDCSRSTKEKAREILKLHARVWKNSPCMPMNLLSSYPS